MDNIREIILGFSESDRKELRLFLMRKRLDSTRKDVELFDELSREELREKKMDKLVGTVSFHSNRKRIMRGIAEFIAVKQLTDIAGINGNLFVNLSLSRFLFEKKFFDTAWKYVLKTEKHALEAEEFDFLISVYSLMMEYSHTSDVYTLEELISRQNISKRLADEENRMVQAMAFIRRKTEEIKRSGEIEGFSSYVESILEEFELDQAMLSRPSLIYRLVEIVRATYLTTRNLTNFEGLLLEQFEHFEKVSNEGKHHTFYRMSFLYMIAHMYYHNRKFSECSHYLEILGSLLNSNDDKYKQQFLARYLSLKCTLLSYSGSNEMAISEMNKFLDDKKIKWVSSDLFNLQLNLSFYYFIQKDFKKANRIFIQWGIHSDSYYEKRMGQEWILRAKMIRSIIQYELGKDDLALAGIRQIEKDHALLLEQAQYLKAKNFLKILYRYMSDPYALNFSEFHSQALKELFVLPAGTEESKAIAFYCYLKSKLLHRDYYEVLLEEVLTKRDD